jgi:hypothetical protein
LETLRNLLGAQCSKRASRENEMDRVRKEVKDMGEERMERHQQVMAIKEGARTDNAGRSYLLPGLWAARLAMALTQRQLAERIGSNQATVRELERLSRGAYPKTIRRLCRVLGVAPEDLLCGG